MGLPAGRGLKSFAETGRGLRTSKDWLGRHDGDGDESVLDVFAAPRLDRGRGRTSTRLFVDGRRSRVSFVSKMVPSPDWFVGVDGMELCRGGAFVDKIKEEVCVWEGGEYLTPNTLFCTRFTGVTFFPACSPGR